MKTLTAATSPLCALAAILLSLCCGEISTPTNAQTESAVIATVDGRKITQAEVDSTIVAQLLPLQQQLYALRKAALENLISRTILEHEAKKRGVSVDELRKQLANGTVEVPASQVEEVFAENAALFAAMSPEEAKERLALDLESQARMKLYRDALAQLRKAAKVELRLEEPRLRSVTEGAAPVIGAREAAVTIIEFSDFQCPYCRAAQSTLKQVLKDYAAVRLVFKHLPLPIHADALASAQAAFCAGEQGAFWQYHDALFGAPALSPVTLNKIASDLGMNDSKFQACLNSEASRSAVLKDVQQAKLFGIDSTPTFIVNGNVIRGAISFEEFKAIIERELKSAQTPHVGTSLSLIKENKR